MRAIPPMHESQIAPRDGRRLPTSADLEARARAYAADPTAHGDINAWADERARRLADQDRWGDESGTLGSDPVFGPERMPPPRTAEKYLNLSLRRLFQ